MTYKFGEVIHDVFYWYGEIFKSKWISEIKIYYN